MNGKGSEGRVRIRGEGGRNDEWRRERERESKPVEDMAMEMAGSEEGSSNSCREKQTFFDYSSILLTYTEIFCTPPTKNLEGFSKSMKKNALFLSID